MESFWQNLAPMAKTIQTKKAAVWRKRVSEKEEGRKRADEPVLRDLLAPGCVAR
jgi:hypothetical protein